MDGSLGDLEDSVQKWAKIYFEENKIGSQKKLSCDSLVFNVDWKRVSIDHEKPNYCNVDKQVKPNAVVLFKTCFDNTTDSQQTNSFQTTRISKKVAEFNISSTFTKSSEACLSLNLPNDVMKLGCNFNRDLSVTRERGQTFEEEISWSVNCDVQVPPKSKRSVQVNITEVKYSCNFSVRTTVRGRVKISITNPEDNNSLVKQLEADIFAVLKETLKKKNDVTFNDTAKEVVFVSRGKASFNFGTEQHVQVLATGLAGDNLPGRLMKVLAAAGGGR